MKKKYLRWYKSVILMIIIIFVMYFIVKEKKSIEQCNKNKIFKIRINKISRYERDKIIFKKFPKTNSFINLNGAKIYFDKLKTKYKIIIVFDINDCSTCLTEYRLWNQIDKYFNKNDIYIIGVCNTKSKISIKKFIFERNIHFPILYDYKRIINKSLDINFTPVRLLLNHMNEIISIEECSADVNQQKITYKFYKKLINFKEKK